MKYELKYEDFSTSPVRPVAGDILVLVCQDGCKQVFRAVPESAEYRCNHCHLSNTSDYWSGLNCGYWNFSCTHGCHVIYISIDTLLEDL